MIPTSRPIITDRPALDIFPLGPSQNITTGAAAAWATPISWRTSAVRLLTTANARVAIGAAPTAVAASTLLAPASPLVARVNADQRMFRGIADVAANTFRFFEWDGAYSEGGAGIDSGTQASLTAGQVIFFLAQGGATLPAPLVENTAYYVRSDGAISSSTTGITPGAALDITSAGTGPWLAVTSDRISCIQDTAAGNVNITELR